MRSYDKNTRKLISVVCNCCGRNLCLTDGILTEGCCQVRQTWDYFSSRDLEQHRFDLCEDCYSRITGAFAVPPEVRTVTEPLDRALPEDLDL